MTMNPAQLFGLWAVQQQAYGRNVDHVPLSYQRPAHDLPQAVLNQGFAEDSNRMGMSGPRVSFNTGMVSHLADHGAHEIRLSPRTSFNPGGDY